MAPPKRPWFRFYVATFRNMNVRVMPYSQRWAWAAVLGMARESPLAGVLLSENDVPLTEAYMAEYAAMKPAEMRAAVRKFHELGMLRLDTNTGALVVVKWDERQFESDNVAERTAKHRAKNVPSNDDGTPDGTTDGTESPSEEDRGSEVQSSSSSSNQLETDRVTEACRLLAERDLARTTAEKGERHDPAAWLLTATDRRWERHHDQAEKALSAHPDWTVEQLVAFLEPNEPEPSKPSPLDSTAAAARVLEQQGVAYTETIKAIPRDPMAAERMRAIRKQTLHGEAKESA